MFLEGETPNPADFASLALYNYGNYTSMRVENRRVRGLQLHLDRLNSDSMQLFGERIDPDRVRELVRDAIKDHQDPVMVRVTVFAQSFDMNRPGDALQPKILVTLRSALPIVPQPAMRLKSVHYTREVPSVKHVGLFGQLHSRRTAQLAGFDDALFIDGGNLITEGVTWNVTFLKSGQFYWPKSDYLPGVTMRLLQHAMTGSDRSPRTETISLADIPDFDAAFATNAGFGVRPISSIDNHQILVAEDVYAALRAAYLTIEGDVI